MHRILLPVLCALLLLLLHGCAVNQSNIEQGVSTEEASDATDTEVSDSPDETPSKGDDASSPANAYYIVFQKLWRVDPGLNGDITYLALDVSGVKSADTDRLTALFQDFCDKNKLTLLTDSFDGLTEKGYIKDLEFRDGLLISFEDQEAGEGKIVTAAKKWRSGLGAVGATYDVTLKDDVWEIGDTSGMWIS